MEDEFGADDSLLEAMAAAADRVSSQQSRAGSSQRAVQQPTPQKIQQPTPQRLDKPPPTSSSGSKIVQPTPQALPQRGTGSHILVSPRQRGNPILTFIRAMGWEYSDIPADYVMGQTTCALFLRFVNPGGWHCTYNAMILRYHRLHPEYVYTRIQKLQGKYTLRILLVMVDIPNHEDSLRELSKTSLVNNITIILCWSAAEAGRYLELYKSYEHAGFTAIKGQQATSYADRLVEFVTVPRNLNKSDAVALVANFGSLKNAINADQEQLSMLNGWGGAKVKRWSKAVEEPFRARKATKKAARKPPAGGNVAQNAARNALEDAIPISRAMQADPTMAASNPSKAGQFQLMGDLDDDDEEEEAMLAAAIEESRRAAQPGPSVQPQQSEQSQDKDHLSGGIAAALAKLREGN
ncbi:unnamed protein product [Clonostachys chloroleuca]|uniref:ERCC1-like central domain-containing protein n=1 Tax=Clonostachys chloroleuca TaxID=1926264 RepID=A0AA35M4E3_9HYPO|nr:unnamed protein product [Clonostachys chloroleuca]